MEMKDKPDEIIAHLRESIDDAAKRSGVIKSHRGIQDSGQHVAEQGAPCAPRP